MPFCPTLDDVGFLSDTTDLAAALSTTVARVTPPFHDRALSASWITPLALFSRSCRPSRVDSSCRFAPAICCRHRSGLYRCLTDRAGLRRRVLQQGCSLSWLPPAHTCGFPSLNGRRGRPSSRCCFSPRLSPFHFFLCWHAGFFMAITPPHRVRAGRLRSLDRLPVWMDVTGFQPMFWVWSYGIGPPSLNPFSGCALRAPFLICGVGLHAVRNIGDHFTVRRPSTSRDATTPTKRHGSG